MTPQLKTDPLITLGHLELQKILPQSKMLQRLISKLCVIVIVYLCDPVMDQCPERTPPHSIPVTPNGTKQH